MSKIKETIYKLGRYVRYGVLGGGLAAFAYVLPRLLLALVACIVFVLDWFMQIVMDFLSNDTIHSYFIVTFMLVGIVAGIWYAYSTRDKKTYL